MEYLYTARFLRSFKKCDKAAQNDIALAIELFEKRENYKNLKLHKLRGKFKKWHAFSANFSYRVIVKIDKGVAYYLDVGTHDVYR